MTPAFLWTMFNGTNSVYIALDRRIVVEATFERNQYKRAIVAAYNNPEVARTVALQLTQNWEDHGYDLNYIRMHTNPAGPGGVVSDMLTMVKRYQDGDIKGLEPYLHTVITRFYNHGKKIYG